MTPFYTDLEKVIASWAHKELIEVRKNTETVPREWTGRNERMEHTEPSITEALHLFPFSRTVLAKSPAHWDPFILGEQNILGMIATHNWDRVNA